MTSIIDLAETGWVPDPIIRVGIRQLVKQRLREELRQPAGTKEARTRSLRDSAIALHTDAANEQHYEVPTDFFKLVLGPRLKYSACIYPDKHATLAQAEVHSLELYKERLGVAEGNTVLDLGCGWGSFSLWLAEHNPRVKITAVSNSATQRRYIESRIAQLALTNLGVITADVNELELPLMAFDKIISVEMFEHVRNYEALMRKIRGWLRPDGTLFTHIFCHKELIYPFEVEGESNWMGRYFFTGGLMPAADTLLSFQDDLDVEERWLHDGTHYQRTARGWLDNMDNHAEAVLQIMRETYGADEMFVWQQRWRIFFMACEEMFAYDQGNQWQVAHYRFIKR
ncbi:MAG: cyclopropane-fatty-acyl-phospholipid synthase family protein [Pseudomonadota bacterium]|nr:cyclopropane-fatty-acyl-phospholipid synthase family protein [Pseudomonadota bacterium]